MKSLNQITRAFLEANGITNKFFSNCIGCDETKCSRWLNEKNNIKFNKEQIKKTHKFIKGDYFKSIDVILMED